jgi:hypothetical protein
MDLVLEPIDSDLILSGDKHMNDWDMWIFDNRDFALTVNSGLQ